jgi:phenylpyruvate tautomerase PptA (4-oxalocrotonate tautomerase family)
VPLLELDTVAGALAPGAQDPLVDGLTGALLAARGVPDTAASRANAWAHVREHDPAVAAYVGGRPAAGGPARHVVRATIVAGGMTDEARTRFVAEATRLVLAAEAPGTDDDPDRVWVLVLEVPDGGWGAGGVITRRADADAILEG